MTTPTPQTPADAFDAMLEKAKKAWSGPVNSKLTLAGLTGRGHRYGLDGFSALDQSVAYPGKRVEISAHLRIIVVEDVRLVVQLLLGWSSIYGRHSSISEYELTKLGSEIGIAPRWQQRITPRTDLTDLDVHTGGTSAEQYHQNTLNWLRQNSNSAVVTMLFDGTQREVDPQELVPLAAEVVTLIPEL